MMNVTNGATPRGTAVAAKPIFRPKSGPLLRILCANALLNLITLGIYRFWGKTRLRRYIWSRLSFLDEPFEYSGTAKELIIGFLIVLAILVPLLAVRGVLEFYFFDPLLAQEVPVALLVLQAVTGFVFLFLLQFAIFRARRYRLTRTRWRGIVAGQSGSAAKYALLAIVLIGLTGVTFGLAYPLMSTTLERYRMGNTWLGTERFAFSGQARELVARWLACWILLVPTLFLSFFWYRAAELRYFTRQTALGTLKFQSGITGGRLFAIYFVYFLAIIGMILLIITVVTATVVDFGNISADPENLAARLGAIGFLPFVLAIVFLLLSNVIYTWLILSRLLKAFCESLSVRGEMNFDALAQSTRSAPTRGEGLADALNIGGL